MQEDPVTTLELARQKVSQEGQIVGNKVEIHEEEIATMI